MMELTEAEKEREYLLLAMAAAIRARLESLDNIDYTIDRLWRVASYADKIGQCEIAVIARDELDLAKRLKGESIPTDRMDELCALCGERRGEHAAISVFCDEHYCPGGPNRGFSESQVFTEA